MARMDRWLLVGAFIAALVVLAIALSGCTVAPSQPVSASSRQNDTYDVWLGGPSMGCQARTGADGQVGC